jgi:antirestriction protein ArdC
MANDKNFIKFCEETTEKIYQGLSKGIIPWRKPWNVNNFQNPVTGSIYSGTNPFWLNIHNLIHGFSSPFFVTYKNAADLGGYVSKGEKSALIGWFSPVEFQKKENGKPITKNGEPEMVKYFSFKTYRVFNIEQLDGDETFKNNLAELLEKKTTENTGAENFTIADADKMIDTYFQRENITLSYGGGRACYSPTFDSIKMPLKKDFVGGEEFYSTLFHEMAHSTGHGARLNRDGIVKFDSFGSEKYSEEELIAEMTAAFSAGYYGFECENLGDNRQAYINGWASKLKSDPKIIYNAAKAAQKAFGYILGKKEKAVKTA